MSCGTVTLKLNDEQITVERGALLSDVIFLEMPCGGHGKCGKCKVIAKGELSAPSDTELLRLSSDELAAGVRLACKTHVLGDAEVRTDLAAFASKILSDGKAGKYDVAPTFKRYGVAIDVGTTTVAGRLFDTYGKRLGEMAMLNPQSRWGADVVSRMEAALGGSCEEIADAVLGAIADLCDQLAKDAKIRTCEIDRLVVTGNTVMLHLLTKTSTEPLSHAPFCAERLFGEVIAAHELGLHTLASDAQVYLPRCISAFIGADTVCAIIASGMCDEDSTALLADVGTNGEIALLSGSSLTLCSTAAGPAFEGAGISMGMRGDEGAIDSVNIVNGKMFAHVIGGAEPRGICGSGLVDALACLLDLEMLDEGGYLDESPTEIFGTVKIDQQDIRAVQMAKSAICAGIETLLSLEGIKASDVSEFYIAGGFGTYLSMKSAVRIGLFPRGLAKSAISIGNAALEGASMLLLDASFAEKPSEIAQMANLIELNSNPMFSEKYMMGMAFDS